ncbi:FAD-binding oxidoreductase [Bowdeniella nasicola]|uniref:FAD-binding oxidoreductase n=1 Tax=Bowdeniella nasicola TaxID=208480 RepID=A0A1Q5Q3F6_9ACTO|nr:FAD-binding and (Fe-S)-binding domain-containing protein [Bowdeniella nasicola]OKL54170.1 FAD-binding oxidoreductase [Bowdeniella nasicola]
MGFVDTEIAALAERLATQLAGEVDAAPRRRAEYTSDAGNYRLLPGAVIYPRDAADVVTTVQFAAEHGVPIAMRGAGTSIAGNAISDGFVLDTSRHLATLHELDPAARIADVDAGVVMGSVQAAAAPFGLRFGPDPSTWTRATFGGMIGNNACGPRAVAYGKTADNVLELDCIDGRGRSFTARAGDLGVVPGLADIVSRYLGPIRTELGTFSRQVSGYSLEHLLPERGRDLPKALVGTEGSLVVVTRARLKLVTAPKNPMLLVLGYADMIAAADDVPRLLVDEVTAVEGFDARLVDYVIVAKGASAVPPMPRGGGWLLVEVADAAGDERAAERRARELAAASGAVDHRILPAGPEAAALWKIRADGAGLGGRTPADKPAWPGLEDAAVPPENLGAYLRDFTAELDRFGLDGLIYGHFGDGCVHVRIDFPLDDPHGGAVMDKFMHAMGEIIVRHGGSISGEHGDGRARSELLTAMYSPELRRAFGEVKKLFDPAGILNPGVITDPSPLAADLRLPQGQDLLARSFTLGSDGHDLGRAVHRCTGVGKCRVTSPGHVMCPSYRATGDEKDTTRARARILQEVANGSFIHSLDSGEVRESLDLCLACKACSSDCPTGIDMARYKSEVLDQIYAGKRRPRTHYTLGWLPRWIRLTLALPGAVRAAVLVAGAVRKVPALERAVLKAAGISEQRRLIPFDAEPFSAWFKRRQRTPQTDKKFVVLWADSFSHLLDGAGARATVEVLEAAGFTVLLAPVEACCGLTYVTTGQLDRARARQDELLRILGPLAINGVPIVGVEPSCVATLRDDLPDLHPGDARAAAVANATHTLAEFLTRHAPNFPLPDLSGVEILAQPHCHHYAVMGWQRDHELLSAAGARVHAVTGCCGMAGNFGMEADHADVSVAVANTALLSALAEHPDALVLADGFSCRTQISQLSSRQAIRLSDLLARRLDMSQ